MGIRHVVRAQFSEITIPHFLFADADEVVD
jgi:hypothetical protein